MEKYTDAQGRVYHVTIEPDEWIGAPWEEFGDVHGVVLKDFPGDELDDEHPGLYNQGGGSWLAYDFPASRERARNVWGCAEKDVNEIVEADYMRLLDYCRGGWGYVSVTVAPSCKCCGAAREEWSASVGAVESDGGYIMDDIVPSLVGDILYDMRHEEEDDA